MTKERDTSVNVNVVVISYNLKDVTEWGPIIYLLDYEVQMADL